MRPIVLVTMTLLAWLSALIGLAHADRIVVFSAASMNDVITELADNYNEETGVEIVVSAAGSAALARQIGAGAPADIFVSANTNWMDVLVEAGDIAPGQVIALAGNRLVLVAAEDALASVGPGELSEQLADTRLAIGLVDSVPAGIYGKAALQSLDLWSDVSDRLAQTDSVRGALQLVATGQAAYGIVYETDVQLQPDLQTVLVFPEDSHPPIIYEAGRVNRDEAHPAADAFFDYLASEAAQAVLATHGFLKLANGS